MSVHYSQHSTIQDIPQDVLLFICSFLMDDELANFGMVSHFFKRLTTHHILWKPRVIKKYFRVLYEDEDMWYPTMCFRYSPFLHPEPRDFCDNQKRTPQQYEELALPSIYQSWKQAWIDLEMYKCWRCFSATKARFDAQLQVKFCPGCNRVRGAENAWTLLTESSATQIFGFTHSDFEEFGLVPSMINGERCYRINPLEDMAVKLFGSLYNTCHPAKAEAARARMKLRHLRKEQLEHQLHPFGIHLENHILNVQQRSDVILLEPRDAQSLKDLIEGFLDGNGQEDIVTNTIVHMFSVLRELHLKKYLAQHTMEHLISHPCCQEFIQQGRLEDNDEGLTLKKVMKTLYWHVREPELVNQLSVHNISDFDYKSFLPAIDFLEGETECDEKHSLDELLELIVMENQARTMRSKELLGFFKYFRVNPNDLATSPQLNSFVEQSELSAIILNLAGRTPKRKKY